MLRRSLSAGLFAVLIALLSFAGCSDDPTEISQVIGDPNSPQFQNMKAAIATSVDSTLGMLMKFGAIPGRFPKDTINYRPELGIMNPEDSVLYNYVSGWNILYLGLTSTATYNYVFVDSVKYLVAGISDQYPSQLTDEMLFIHHQSNAYKGSASDFQDFTSYVNVNFKQVQDPSEEYIQGVGRFILDDHYTENNVDQHDVYDFAVTVSTMKFTDNINDPWWAGHPSSGSITLNGMFTDGSATQTWTVTAAFDADGEANIQATYGNVVYSYSITPSYQ